MRYAHYIAVFSDRKSNEAFNSFYLDVASLIKNVPDGVELSGKDGRGQPTITPSSIVIGDRNFDEAFSELSIHVDEAWPTHRFPLKMIVTEKRSYDIIICSSLLSLVHHFPDIEVTTDGRLKDWEKAIGLYEYTTQRKAPFIYFQD